MTQTVSYKTPFKYTTKTFIKKSKEIFGNKFNYKNFKYIGIHSGSEFICNYLNHGSFTVTPYLHLSGKYGGCPDCRYGRTREHFIEIASKKFNNKFNYDNIEFVDMETIISIPCPIKEHGNFYVTPKDHLKQKNSCQICYNANYTTESFIKLSKEIFGDIFSYSYTIFSGILKKVILTCKIHGNFEKLASDHLHNKQGCPKCSKEKASLNLRDSKEDFISKSIKLHGDIFGYEKIEYINSGTKVELFCKKCKEYFWQTPRGHLYGRNRAGETTGRGCEKCSRAGSKMEKAWLDSLNIPESWRKQTLHIGKKRYYPDAIDFENKVVYEFHGDLFHGNPEVYDAGHIHPLSGELCGDIYKNTLFKEQTIKQAGYALITIWEKEWTELNKKKAK